MSRTESTGVAGAGLDEQARRLLEVKQRALRREAAAEAG
jgi:hypothetical protein